MVILRLKGRLGNCLFSLSEALYYAKQYNEEMYLLHSSRCETFDESNGLKEYFKIIESDYRATYYHDEIYGKEFFSKIKMLEVEDLFTIPHITVSNASKLWDIRPEKSKSILINAYFSGKQCVHDDVISNLYKPSKKLVEEMMDLYAPDRDTLSMHIRRGDFLDASVIKGGWYSCPAEYWEKAYKILNKKYSKTIIISDDIKWCKNSLNIPGNVVYADKETNCSRLFLDLFLPSFCGDNVISGSTFSWWMQYLNKNPHKKVVMPYPWCTIESSAKNKIYYTKDCIKLGIYDYKIK